jgi:hypothetical protein
LTAIGTVFLLVTIPICYWYIYSYKNNTDRSFSLQSVEATNREYAHIVINHEMIPYILHY